MNRILISVIITLAAGSAWATSFQDIRTIDGTQAIKPWSQNPYYWQFKGKPVLLIGGSNNDNFFQDPDLERNLDQIKSSGGNYIRNTMSDRRIAGFEVYPFKKQPDGKYNLEQPNEDYWLRFENMLSGTAARDIIVQVEIWDRFDFTGRHWESHPYNPQNNVNYTRADSGFDLSYPEHPGRNKQPFFHTTPGQRNIEVVLEYQRKFVDQILSRTLNYSHVLYCIDNETSGEEAWALYWTEYIQRKADEAGKQICLTEMWDSWDLENDQHRRTLDHPQLYKYIDISQNNHQQGQAHWDKIQWVRSYISDTPRPLNSIKVYGADSGRFGNKNDGIERWWRLIVGGAASARFHRPPAGLGLSAPVTASLLAARKLESVVKLWDLEPANDLFRDRAPNEAYLAARPGHAYVVYFPNGGEVGIDMRQTQGNFDLHWININTGNWGGTEMLKGGAVVRLAAPAKGHWVAAIVHSFGLP